MALQILSKRQFILKLKDGDITLDDPESSMTTKAAVSHFSGLYPQLTSSTVTGPEMVEGIATYTISAKEMGTLG